MPPQRRPLGPHGSFAVIALALASAALLFDPAVTSWLTSEAVYQRFEPRLMLVLDGAAGIILLAILHQHFRGVRPWVGFLLPIGLSTGMTHLVKWIVGRTRPKLELGAWHFEPFTADAAWASFPSGHTSYAVTLALLLGVYFPRARWLFLVLAGLTAVERVVHREHHLSDVLAGAAVGFFAVWVSLRVLPRRYYELPGLPQGTA